MSYEVPDRLRDHNGYQRVNCSEENVLLPLVTFEEDEIHFDEQTARETFANEIYHGKKISLVSVMGPSRMGKSFLMSVLTGGIKANKISGAFQSGYEHHTEGILIFVNPVISKDGSHVIFFLDTQGTFDLKTERNISAWIAGFSLLISDVQIVNLRGSIGGDDLHDLNIFVESAAAFKEGSVAKSLIFVIRDAADWNETEFLEKLWNQNEKSKELKEIASSLKSRFINGIDCVCVVPASDRIRQANRTLELEEEDLTLIKCLGRVELLVYEKCKHESKAQLQAPIELAKKITAYLQEEALEPRPTVQMIQGAVNKAFDVFAKAVKVLSSWPKKKIALAETSTPETLSMDEAFGKVEVHRKFEALLSKKEHLIAEAHALLDPKIAEMILQKQNEFAQLNKEKNGLKGTEKFAQELRKRIQKISTLKEALHWERESIIEKYGSFTIPSTVIHSMKEALSTKIITLQLQFIQTRLNELNNELRVYLLTANFDNVPEKDQIKVHITKVIDKFKIECLENAIKSAQFSAIEGEIQSTLEETGSTCRNMLVTKKIAEIKKAELEAKVAAEIQKSNSANYSDTASDSENDLEEEHEIRKARSNGSLNVLDLFKEVQKEEKSGETSLGLMGDHGTSPCYKSIPKPSQEVELKNERNIVNDSLPINLSGPGSPKYDEIADTESFVSKALSKARENALRKPSQEVELNSETNTVDDASRIEKTGPRLEPEQKEPTVTDANRDLVDSRSASLSINLPRPESPEYDEVSDTELDLLVSKPLEEDAVREMDYKFRVLKAILEVEPILNKEKSRFQQIDDKNEKQRHFEAIYQEYAVWCKARIDWKVMMYFVNKFHTDCALYMREHHQIEVDVRRFENELIRHTENPKWTDAQKLKRKVLQRRKSNPKKKKICSQKVRELFDELLAEQFQIVIESGPNIAKISALVECSKSERDVFSRTLCKYDKNGELPGLLNKVLLHNWIFFFYSLPHKGFGESNTFNEYERVRRELSLDVPHGTHITFLSDTKEWFLEQKKKQERQERKRRENEEEQRQAEILRRLEAGNNSRNRFSLPTLPNITWNSASNPSGMSPQSRHEHPQAIIYQQSGSRSNQTIDSGREKEKVGDQTGAMQSEFHFPYH